MSKDHGFITSSTERPSPYENWLYNAVSYTLSDGTTIKTARVDIRQNSRARWDAIAAEKCGNPVGFGERPHLLVTDWEVLMDTAETNGRLIQINHDAATQLRNVLKDSRPASVGYTEQELSSLSWLEEKKGKYFELTNHVSQWSNEQFFNTAAESKEVPGGRAIPRGLAKKILPSAAIHTMVWAGKQVPVCSRHSDGFATVAGAMGQPTPIIIALEETTPCTGCHTESRL